VESCACDRGSAYRIVSIRIRLPRRSEQHISMEQGHFLLGVDCLPKRRKVVTAQPRCEDPAIIVTYQLGIWAMIIGGNEELQKAGPSGAGFETLSKFICAPMDGNRVHLETNLWSWKEKIRGQGYCREIGSS
jgi:hypothetical protein